jgi:putative endonuclease
MPYYVYVLLCDDGSFYTGYTRNVNSRMRLHVNGRGARYTRIHKPKRLVYTEEFGSRAEAMKRERRLKTMRHDQKSRLIKSKSRAVRKMRRRKRL